MKVKFSQVLIEKIKLKISSKKAQPLCVAVKIILHKVLIEKNINILQKR